VITPRFTPCAGLELELGVAAAEPELFAELELVFPLEGVELAVLPLLAGELDTLPLPDTPPPLVAFLPAPDVVPGDV